MRVLQCLLLSITIDLVRYKIQVATDIGALEIEEHGPNHQYYFISFGSFFEKEKKYFGFKLIVNTFHR